MVHLHNNDNNPSKKYMTFTENLYFQCVFIASENEKHYIKAGLIIVLIKS